MAKQLRTCKAEPTAEADRGRHPGFRASTSVQAAPAASPWPFFPPPAVPKCPRRAIAAEKEPATADCCTQINYSKKVAHFVAERSMDKCSGFTLQRRNRTGGLLHRRQHLPAKEHSTMNKIPTLVVASICLVLFVFAALTPFGPSWQQKNRTIRSIRWRRSATSPITRARMPSKNKTQARPLSARRTTRTSRW